MSEEKVNPKFGIQWNITDNLVFRGAYIQFVKPVLASNQTLEPTQVAGFNQLFDDANGDLSKQWGVGLDHRLLSNLFIGGETTWRDVDTHAIIDERDEALDADEQTHRYPAPRFEGA